MVNTLAFIILHGAWQASSGWRAVAVILKKAGFPVFLMDLPGHGVYAQVQFLHINLQTYVDYVAQKVQELQKKMPVVLVGHSMSGMVISQVAQQMSVHHLVYVAAFLPINGENLLDIAKRSPIAGIKPHMVMNRNRKSITLNKNGLDKLFYNDCRPEVVAMALSRLQEEPLLPFYDDVELTQEKFGQTPKSYIECTNDYTLSIELQRFMHGRWPCTVYSLESGHAPFYSVPEQLADTLMSCVR